MVGSGRFGAATLSIVLATLSVPGLAPSAMADSWCGIWALSGPTFTRFTHAEVGHPLGILTNTVEQTQDPGWGNLPLAVPIWTSAGGPHPGNSEPITFTSDVFAGCHPLNEPYFTTMTVLGDDNYDVFVNGLLVVSCHYPAEADCWSTPRDGIAVILPQGNQVVILAKNSDGAAMIEYSMPF